MVIEFCKPFVACVFAAGIVCASAFAAPNDGGQPVIDNAQTYPMLTRDQFSPAPEQDLADMRLIKQRLRDYYQSTAGRKVEQTADQLLKTQTPEGSWPDIDYAVRAKIFFPQFPHVQRLAAMSVAYRDPKNPLHQSAELRRAIVSGLEFWCRTNPQTDHHWFIEIGSPMELLPTLILMESELSPEQIKAALPLLRASYREGLFRYGPNEATGANMMWVARMNLEASLLEEDAFAVTQAARRFEQEIKVTEREGIQPDWSFTQHGHQLYAAGYGGAYAADASHVAEYLAGTRFAFDPKRVEIIANYIVNGQQWMMRGYHWISGPKGREISRKIGGKPPSTSVAETLAAILPDRKDELTALGKRMRGAVPPTENAVSGNRHFWRVDLMTHHRADWMAAVRMASKRVVGTESGNTENLQGHHLADGVLEVMVSGEEYRGIYPLWNWRQLPGTTVAQVTGPLPEHNWGKNARGTTDFVGGASDGNIGIATFDFDRDGVKAHKTWVFLDDQIIALGAGLSSDSDAPVITTINQCWRRGEVLVSFDDKPATPASDGTTSIVGPAWVWHDSIGYIIPAGAKATLQLERRTSSWKAINPTQPDAEITGDIFTLFLTHDVRPTNAKYEYTILPATKPGQVAASIASLKITNEPGLQAAVNSKTGEALVSFFAPGTFVNGDMSVQVDKPCLVIVSARGICVSDPAAKPISVNVVVRSAGNERRELVQLPAGPYAGQTVVLPPTKK